MKKQKTQSKLIVALTAVVLLLVALSATLTFAYFTAQSNTTSSQMTFGVLSIDAGNLSATKTSDECSAQINSLVPGCTVDLAGKAIISSNIDYYTRLSYVVKGTKGSDTTDVLTPAQKTQLIATLFKTTTNGGGLTYTGTTAPTNSFADIETAATWVYYDGTANEVDDGWYYFNTKKLAADNDFIIFDFTGATVKFDETTYGDDWQGINITITITVQTIQANHLSNNGTAIVPEVTVLQTTGTAVSGTSMLVSTLAGADAWETVTNNGTTPQQQGGGD